MSIKTKTEKKYLGSPIATGSQEVPPRRTMSENMQNRCEESRSTGIMIFAVNGAAGGGIAQIRARDRARTTDRVETAAQYLGRKQAMAQHRGHKGQRAQRGHCRRPSWHRGVKVGPTGRTKNRSGRRVYLIGPYM